MIWEGLSGGQLCQLFKDPVQNGHRNVAAILEHMKSPLVLWGWNPGPGRTPVAMPQSEFQAKLTEWMAKGAACPTVPPLTASARPVGGLNSRKE
jgi:hypothetical protein